MQLPKNKETIIKNAKKVVALEKKSIDDLEKRFLKKDFKKNFSNAVETIYKCKGKVIVSGIGKSGIIAQKIVSTFNSTGTYSIFLHSVDSLHGDLGMVKEDDIVILISKSGDTPEVKKLIPIFKDLKMKIITITGDINSPLANVSDIILDTSVREEACPYNLAPTSSSTSMLVLGDALAISLLKKRKFKKEDFAFFHPGGILGRKLNLKVNEIMTKGDDIPVVNPNTNLKDVIYMISSKRLGCTVVKENEKVLGIIADGDIRRLLEKNLNVKHIKAKDIMSKNPKNITSNTLAKTALEIMEKNKITQLIVCDSRKKLIGIIHMHVLVELGL